MNISERKEKEFSLLCSLGKIGFKIFSFKMEDLPRVRVFEPVTLDGVELKEAIISRLISAYEKESGPLSSEAFSLGKSVGNRLYKTLIQDRSFSLNTLNYLPTFESIAEMSKLYSADLLNRMLAISGSTTNSISQLISAALYTEPHYMSGELGKMFQRLGFLIGKYIFRGKIAEGEERILCDMEKSAEKVAEEVFYKAYAEEVKNAEKYNTPELKTLRSILNLGDIDTVSAVTVGKIYVYQLIDNFIIGIGEFVFREIYRTLRKSLTKEEKRLFQLLYFPQVTFGNRIMALASSQVLWSFFKLDKRIQITLILSLIYRVNIYKGKPVEEYTGIRNLEDIFKRYLRFYPCWLQIVRSDEAELKKNKRDKRRRESHDQWKISRTRILSLNQYPDPLINLIITEDKKRIVEALQKHCTDLQRECISKHIYEDRTLHDIAKSSGISHSMVAKHIKAGLTNLKRALGDKS